MQRSNLVDPFEGMPILSLNPRTFGDSKDAPKSNDLETIHQHMISMALQFPDKDFEKARSIVDGGLEFINTNKSEADTNDKENPQANRPALARKRAKFSLKLDTSQPSTVLEPSFQIDQQQDPEEFFAAFEKFENARKEMKRQRGDEDLNDAKISSTARRRRPEIPRRKTSYKHHEYFSQFKNDTSFAQETLQDNIGSPPVFCSQQESVTPIWESKEDELSGSITEKEDILNKLVDKLMTSNIDGLNGKDALSFLKDHLKIKPVDISDLQLPDINDIHRLDFISPLKNLIKTTPPPQSPFLAISTFGKRISKSIESNDPFSAHDIDSFPTTVSTESNKELPISGTLDSLAKTKVTETVVGVTQKISAGASINSPESDKLLIDTVNGCSATGLMEDREQCHNMEERDVNETEVGPCVVTGIQTNEGIKGNVEDVVQKAASVAQLDINFEEITDNVHLQCLQDREENVGDMTEKAGSSTLREVNVEVSTIEDLEGHRSQSAKTGANSTEGLDASGPTEDPDIVPEQQNEEHPNTSTNKRKNTTRTREVDQRKRRQSLAEAAGTSWESGVRRSNRDRRRPLEYWKGERPLYGRVHNKAGTSWESGVRRSNRVRRRPLEYWKGERPLYGRVHNSLPTIIGVKYICSTTDNGKPGFKVESFVSDQYKELVELTALH